MRDKEVCVKYKLCLSCALSHSRSLDAIHLMSYDLNGAWDNQTGHNAPLYARPDEKGNERETLNVVRTLGKFDI